MSGNVRFCPVVSTPSRLSASTLCTNRTYSNFPHAADRTYQTFAPPQVFFAWLLHALRALSVSLSCAQSSFVSFQCFLPQCPEMSGFVRSSHRSPGFHHRQDLQQFTLCSRPDIAQTGTALRPIAQRCLGPAGRASVPQCLRNKICQCPEKSSVWLNVIAKVQYPAQAYQPLSICRV